MSDWESGAVNSIPNQASFHWDFGSTHVPNSMANDLLDVLRGLNGL